MSDSRKKAENLLKLGFSHEKSGRLKEAEKEYQAAVETDPTFEGAWLALGMVLQDQGNVPASMVTFRMALDHLPESAPIWCNLGTMYLQVETMEGLAEDAFRRAIECDPGLGAAWVNLGYVLAKHSSSEEAEQVLRDATEIASDDYNVWISFTSILIDSGKCTEAREAFNRTRSLTPTDDRLNKVGRRLEQRCKQYAVGIDLQDVKEVPHEDLGLTNRLKLWRDLLGRDRMVYAMVWASRNGVSRTFSYGLRRLGPSDYVLTLVQSWEGDDGAVSKRSTAPTEDLDYIRRTVEDLYNSGPWGSR
ncbi:MAG: tetratricopeptide repeat protein [Thermoplasmata archaeon]